MFGKGSAKKENDNRWKTGLKNKKKKIQIVNYIFFNYFFFSSFFVFALPDSCNYYS